MGFLVVHFDGLCEPVNPGGVMAWGFTVSDGAKILAAESGSKPAAPENTNNVAEYMALGYALRWVSDAAKADDFAGMQIYGDSSLVVNQINGQWRVKAPKIQPLHARCLELLKQTGQPWVLEWVPREQNESADALSRAGYRLRTGKEAPGRNGAAWRRKEGAA